MSVRPQEGRLKKNRICNIARHFTRISLIPHCLPVAPYGLSFIFFFCLLLPSTVRVSSFSRESERERSLDMKNAADKLCAIKPQPIGLKRVSCDAMRCAAWRVATWLRFAMRNGRELPWLLLQLASGCAGFVPASSSATTKTKPKNLYENFCASIASSSSRF